MTDNSKPSPSELAILKTLWKQSPLSAREIHEVIKNQLNWSFSSTRKTLERMTDKKFLQTKEVHGIKVYQSKLSKINTLANYVRDLAYRVLEVDTSLPVSMFADSKLLDKNELKELEDLLGKETDINTTSKAEKSDK